MRRYRPNALSLIPLLLGAGACAVAAKTYYMGPNGSDNATGAFGAPWATLAKANGTLAEGDTLYLRGGTYSGASGIEWTKSAVREPIVIAAYPGELPVFDGKGANWLLLVTGSMLVFDGLEVTNYGLWGIQISGGNGVVVRNARFRKILAKDNAAIVTRQCHHVIVENSLFEEMGRGPDAMAFDHAVYNSEGASDITIRNNLFRNNFGGPAINHYHQPSPYNVDIYNNVFVMAKGAERSGIYAGDGAHDIRVFNNTFFLDGTAGAVKGYGVTLNSGAGTNSVRNNIFHFKDWSSQDAVAGVDGNAFDYNLYHPQMDKDDDGSHSLAGDPLFKIPGSDFRLQDGSPARGKARPLPLNFNVDIEGTPRPAGAWDMGAYQSGDGTFLSGPTRGKPQSIPGGLRTFGGVFRADGRWIAVLP
jgi:hypothetical protein